NEISDVRPDRHLTLEPPASEASIIDERLPQQTFRFGRISAQEARQPTHTTATVFGEQVAQFLRLFRVEYAATCRTFSSLHDRVDDTMQCADVLLGRS